MSRIDLRHFLFLKSMLINIIATIVIILIVVVVGLFVLFSV